MTAYAFRPMSVSDLPTIRRWLETPHVAEWWHDPSEQFELVSGDLADPDMAQFIVSADAREFAYLQCYNLGVWDTGFGPQPEGARGLDQFIGETGMLGRGHGSAFIRAFADRLLASGTPRVVIDPRPRQRACDPGLCEGRILPRAHRRYAGRPGAADGTQSMTASPLVPAPSKT